MKGIYFLYFFLSFFLSLFFSVNSYTLEHCSCECLILTAWVDKWLLASQEGIKVCTWMNLTSILVVLYLCKLECIYFVNTTWMLYHCGSARRPVHLGTMSAIRRGRLALRY
jgi:hypothetical protein